MKPLAATFGDSLRRVRELKLLTLREVEGATGISNAYLSQLESNKVRRPSPQFLHKLATLYEIDYFALMAEVGYVPPKPIGRGYLFPLGKKLDNAGITKDEEAELLDYLHFIRVRKRRECSANRPPPRRAD